MSKTYRAIVEAKDGMPSDDYDSSLLRMELVFAVGSQSFLTPEEIVEQTLKELHIYNFMTVVSIKEVPRDGLHSNPEPD
jgi:hypothetical protein